MEKLALGVRQLTKNPTRLREVARSAEKAGFHSLWTVGEIFLGDPFAILGYLAASTSTIKLGVGVANPFTAHPATVAMAASTLQTLSGGRLILGLGKGDIRTLKDTLLIGSSDIHRRFWDAFKSIRSLLAGKASGRSEFFRRKVYLKAPRHRTPILVGASGEKTLRMAADLADGVILNVFVSPKLASESLAKIEPRIRSKPNFLKACAILIRPTNDVESLAKKMRTNVALALTWPEGRLIAESASLPEGRLLDIRKQMKRGRVDQAASLVPLEIVKSVVVMGTPGMCRERVAEYRAAGVDLPILYAPPRQVESVLSIFG